MGISSRFIANILFLAGLITVSKGRTLRPNPSQNDNSNSISLTVTSPILPTTPSQTVTTYNVKTNTKPEVMAQNKKKDNAAKNNTTIPAAKGQDKPDKDGLPLWGYILIGIGCVIVVLIFVFIGYAKFIKWKDHGTYMVWDDAELETSPAFTRESEFLLETQTGGQENTPELQRYEIPLDSVTSHPRISYVGTKRVAPKKQEEKRRTSKDYRKKDGESHTPSLTKFTKRDTVYNSVTDTCITSVMSEGTLDGHDSTSSHTLATVMFSNGGLDKYGSTTQFNTIDPKQDKSQSIGNRARSVSNLIQSRPLPAVPINKRFSKSLDKFRFFNTLPVINTKESNRKAGLLYEPSYTNLVKSASYGSNLHRTVNNNLCLPILDDQPALFATRKSSLDIHIGVTANKLHRKSKSLDTLTLLKGIDFNVTNVDIYHSYESVHNNDLEYIGVSDSQLNSPTMSDYTPHPTKTKDIIKASSSEREGIYASLSHEDLQRKFSQEIEGNNAAYDSSTLSSVSSNATSPYASVRISQIPGLSYDLCEHQDIYNTKTQENSGESFETATPENSGSSGVELKPTMNSARSSTHTYIELFPEQTGRDSVISETSSGYARPVDIMEDVVKTKEHDNDKSERNSLTDIKIPVEDNIEFDKTHSKSEVYDNPVNISDDSTEDSCHQHTIQDGINLDDSIDDVHVNIRPLLKRNDSEQSEYEI